MAPAKEFQKDAMRRLQDEAGTKEGLKRHLGYVANYIDDGNWGAAHGILLAITRRLEQKLPGQNYKLPPS